MLGREGRELEVRAEMERRERAAMGRGGPCGWRRGKGCGGREGGRDVVVSPGGGSVGRRGRAVYRNVQLGDAVEVAGGGPWARYAEVRVESGGGVCVGVCVEGAAVAARDALVGSVGEAVGFHDSGRLVRGGGEWARHVAAYGVGDVVGVLVSGGGEAPAGVVDGVLSTSAAGSLGAAESPRGARPAGGGAGGVQVAFAVNGVFGAATALRAAPGARLALRASMYGKDLCLAGACCEKDWARFAAAAKAARPAAVRPVCEGGGVGVGVGAGGEGSSCLSGSL